MALFKLRFPGRLGSNSPSADALSNTPAESVEVIRKRARHRLMGSVILVLGAVVGLPLLFDSQPRPVAIDTPIVIPDRNQMAPLVSPTAQSANPKPEAATQEVVMDAASPQQPSIGAAVNAGAPAAAPSVVAANAPNAKNSVSNASALDPNEEVVTKAAKPETKPETKSETKSETKPEPKADAKPDAKDSAKAKALLDGKETGKSADQAVRSVVQVGAFADIAKAKEARAKLESAGLKTYTQEVDTKDGKRTRVRVGPFATKEEADKTAEKIRKLNLQATVLKL
jgi:DedD protein